jgi:hypothetical protein
MNDLDLLQKSERAVRDSGRGSVTFLREKFSIGFSRATNIRTMLQKKGVVDGNGEVVPLEKPNCAENGIALRKTAEVAGTALIVAEFEKFTEDATSVEEKTVSMANRARKIGLHLMSFTGHEQISFDFWQKHCDGKLPFKFETAKMFVSVARGMEKPAKTLTEAVKWIQDILRGAGILELPSREENQVAVAVNVLQKFFKELTCLSQPFKKMEKEFPIEAWTKRQVETGLAETEWLDMARNRMVKRQNELIKEL